MTDGEAYDAVVVGAGLGGLVAGAKLARSGESVLVLEQHEIPGGCATTFQRRDFEFEVSLHEMDGFDEHDVKRDLLTELDVLDDLTLAPIDEFYRYRSGDRDVVVPHGRDDLCDRLADEFPEDADGIRRFVDTVLDIRESLTSEAADATDQSLWSKLAFAVRNPTFARYRNATVGEFLDECVDGNAPKRVLTANIGYYHDDPYSLSLPFYAVAQGGYVAGGGHYIEGGSQELADALAAAVESAGGTVETGRRVTDILVSDGAATGVRHEASRPGRTDRTGDDVRTAVAGTVVANAPAPLVADELLSAPHGEQLAAQFEDWTYAPSLTTLYLGLNTPAAELGCEHYTTVLQHPHIESLADVATVQRESFGRRTLSFVDYSQIDADLAPAGKSVAAVSTVDYIDEWCGLSDAEYREKKGRVVDVLVRRVGEQYPDVADAVEHAELATPRTIRRYTLNPGGTAYGFAQTPDQSLFARRLESSVADLSFASAWAFPGGGFTGAMLSGSRAASAILDR